VKTYAVIATLLTDDGQTEVDWRNQALTLIDPGGRLGGPLNECNRDFAPIILSRTTSTRGSHVGVPRRLATEIGILV
jgi:hypothetical protein